jgi:hypothetical protein
MDVGSVKDASQLKVEGTPIRYLTGSADNIAYMEHYANQPACAQIVLASLNDQYIPDNAYVVSFV